MKPASDFCARGGLSQAIANRGLPIQSRSISLVPNSWTLKMCLQLRDSATFSPNLAAEPMPSSDLSDNSISTKDEGFSAWKLRIYAFLWFLLCIFMGKGCRIWIEAGRKWFTKHFIFPDPNLDYFQTVTQLQRLKTTLMEHFRLSKIACPANAPKAIWKTGSFGDLEQSRKHDLLGRPGLLCRKQNTSRILAARNSNLANLDIIHIEPICIYLLSLASSLSRFSSFFYHGTTEDFYTYGEITTGFSDGQEISGQGRFYTYRWSTRKSTDG